MADERDDEKTTRDADDDADEAAPKGRTKGSAARGAKSATSRPAADAPPKLSAAEEAAMAAEQERTLGRRVGFGLPIVTVLGALAVGALTSVGPAILVLAAGALLGAIVLLWASLRTLGGDAPLAESFATMGSKSSRHDDLSERKDRVLRALKDLENERAIGKLDEKDYAEVSARYRVEAKQILRELDDEVAPLRARAEEVAGAYLRKRGLGATDYRSTPGGASADGGEDDADEESSDDVVASAKVSRRVAPAPSSSPDASEDDVSGTDDDARDVPSAPPAAKPKRADEAKVETTKKSMTGVPDPRPVCPSCATPNDVDATFCKKCATRLEAASASDRDQGDEGEETEAADAS